MDSHLSTEDSQFILLGRFPALWAAKPAQQQRKREQGSFCHLEPYAERAPFGQLSQA